MDSSTPTPGSHVPLTINVRYPNDSGSARHNTESPLTSRHLGIAGRMQMAGASTAQTRFLAIATEIALKVTMGH